MKVYFKVSEGFLTNLRNVKWLFCLLMCFLLSVDDSIGRFDRLEILFTKVTGMHFTSVSINH